MKTTSQIITSLALILLMSCSMAERETDSLPELDNLAYELKEYFISGEQLKLYANLTEYNRVKDERPVTKSFTDDIYNLDALLDYTQQKSGVFRKKTFTQIPFKQNTENVLACIHKNGDIVKDSCSLVKKYFIVATGKDSSRDMYIVTMIPKANDSTSESCDFLNKAGFSGVCLYSSLAGENVSILRYFKGRICCAIPLTAEDESDEDTEYLSLIDVVRTRGDDDGIPIEGSICIGYTGFLDPSYCIGIAGSCNKPGDDGKSSGGHGGPGSNKTQDSNDAGGDLLYPQQDECFLEVVSNLKDTVYFSCNGRCYTKGSYIFITPTIKIPFDMSNYEFSSWAGDFSEQTTDAFLLTVEDNYCSIAYYNTASPCVDKATGKANPLVNMSVAPAGGWNYFGGTFGLTREKKTKNHAGIDLEARPGTPVFSMFDGIVTKVVDFYMDKQVNHCYGNEIHIESVFRGQTITIQYAHLQAGSPIAYNPFSNGTLKVGDKVLQGQLIGYTGRTGNAYEDKDVPNKHLHLGIMQEGEWINPSPYINGDVPVSQSKKGKIDNIKCD